MGTVQDNRVDEEAAAEASPDYLAELAKVVLPPGAKFVMPDGTEVMQLPNMPDDRTIHQRLVAILAELPAIGKDAYNQQQQFHYRSHDQVLNALNPLLAKHGVFLVPYVMKRSTAERQTGSGKVMYEVNLHVQYEFCGAAGDSVLASAWGEGTDMGDKATNKAMTMAFKNVIAQVFAISTAESQDTDASAPEETEGRVSGDRSRSQGQRVPRATPASPAPQPPAEALLPGAIQGEGFKSRLAEALTAIDATVDWGKTIAPGVKHVFGVEARVDIPQDREAEFWRRLSNAERKLRDLFPAGTFPPPEPDDAQILDVLQWAFDGAPIDRLVLTDEAQRQLDEAAFEQHLRDSFPSGEGEETTDGDGTETGEAPAAAD